MEIAMPARGQEGQVCSRQWNLLFKAVILIVNDAVAPETALGVAELVESDNLLSNQL